LLLGRVDFSNLFINLKGNYPSVAAAKAAGAATLNYGMFMNTVINFLIVAFAIFLLLRYVNRMFPKPKPAPAPAMKDCRFCYSSIPAQATRCPHCTSDLKGA